MFLTNSRNFIVNLTMKLLLSNVSLWLRVITKSMVSLNYIHRMLFCCISQTKTNITKMESFQRYKTPVERQDPTEQRYLEMLAHAVWVFTVFIYTYTYDILYTVVGEAETVDCLLSWQMFHYSYTISITLFIDAHKWTHKCIHLYN